MPTASIQRSWQRRAKCWRPSCKGQFRRRSIRTGDENRVISSLAGLEGIKQLLASHSFFNGLKWWPGTELNRRRQPFQGCALPPELPGHVSKPDIAAGCEDCSLTAMLA